MKLTVPVVSACLDNNRLPLQLLQVLRDSIFRFGLLFGVRLGSDGHVELVNCLEVHVPDDVVREVVEV